MLDRDAPGLFPPEVIVQVRALACELPATSGVPLSRWSTAELNRHVRQSGLVAQVSDSTLWRWLHEDAIRPWHHRCWIFPRDPDFAARAGPLLDLYERQWEGKELRPDEFVISADEKTSIQARRRLHASEPSGPDERRMKVEHEYERMGAWAYIAAWDVHRAKVFGRSDREARKVFWIVDNGSSHRGQASTERLEGRYANLKLVHGPVHASWLNQIEIYFSIIQRKVLTPNDFVSLSALADRLYQFERHYEKIAEPFEWKFTRADLAQLMERLRAKERLTISLAA